MNRGGGQESTLSQCKAGARAQVVRDKSQPFSPLPQLQATLSCPDPGLPAFAWVRTGTMSPCGAGPPIAQHHSQVLGRRKGNQGPDSRPGRHGRPPSLLLIIANTNRYYSSLLLIAPAHRYYSSLLLIATTHRYYSALQLIATTHGYSSLLPIATTHPY
jgi:hypothetical protein